MDASKRAQQARKEIARMTDGVAEVAAAIDTCNDSRLTRARVSLDNLVAPHYLDGIPPYRRPGLAGEHRDPVAQDDVLREREMRDEMLRYKHALEAISQGHDEIPKRIAKRALEE
jgi:hypothetical protein